MLKNNYLQAASLYLVYVVVGNWLVPCYFQTKYCIIKLFASGLRFLPEFSRQRAQRA
jgi:hypothetical protein